MVTITDVLLLVNVAISVKLYLDLRKSRDAVELLIRERESSATTTIRRFLNEPFECSKTSKKVGAIDPADVNQWPCLTEDQIVSREMARECDEQMIREY